MANSPDTLQRGQLGLFGVIMPGLAQVEPCAGRGHPRFRTPAAAAIAFVAPSILIGIVYALVLSIVRPGALERAPALLEGEESLEAEPGAAGIRSTGDHARGGLPAGGLAAFAR
jgi:hypothetical protein